MIKKLFWVFCTLCILIGKSWALDVLYYSTTDGNVRGVDVATGDEVALIPSTVFKGAVVGAAREIAIDPVDRLLWYSATDNAIYSFHLDTLAEGPSIASSKIPGAAVGSGRHLFIDYSRRHLLVPTTSGDIKRFDLDTQAEISVIPATFFTDGNVGTSRHLASDIRTGNIWYAATDGSFREFNPDSMTHTGRQIAFSEQFGADPGAFRHFVVDPNRDLLLYAVTDGSIATIPLTTLTRGTIGLGSNVFTGADTGAGRIISYDITGIAGGNSGNATFASNYLILPFVTLGSNALSATLRFDPDQNIFLVEHYESIIRATVSSVTFDPATGLLTIPAVDYQGNIYHVTLKQIPGTLNFTLETVTKH